VKEAADGACWLYGEAADRGVVPPREAEAFVTRLAQMLDEDPLDAPARSLDLGGGLTTTHVLNVALLAMGLGRHLAFDEEEVISLGLAGLLHDVGRARTRERTRIGEHPARGARLLLDSGGALSAAAVVAYEHHIGWQGTGGYPTLRFARPPHAFSRIVSLCDTYDVLRTERPFRPGLSVEAADRYLEVLAGTALDPEIVKGFGGFVAAPHAWIEHPSTRPQATLADVPWLPETGFDPDFESPPTAT